MRFNTAPIAFDCFVVLFTGAAMIFQLTGLMTNQTVTVSDIIIPYAVIMSVLSLFAIHRHFAAKATLDAVNAVDVIRNVADRHNAMQARLHSTMYIVIEFAALLASTTTLWFRYGDTTPTFIIGLAALLTLLLFTTAFSPVSIGVILASCAMVIIDHFASIMSNIVFWLFTLIFAVFALRALWLLGCSSLQPRGVCGDMLECMLLSFSVIVVGAFTTVGILLSLRIEISPVIIPVFSTLMIWMVERSSMPVLEDSITMSALAVLKTRWFDVRGAFKWMAPLSGFLTILFIKDESLDVVIPFFLCLGFMILDRIRLPRYQQNQTKLTQVRVVRIPPSCSIQSVGVGGGDLNMPLLKEDHYPL